jgi:hypothetical protein
MEAAGIEAIGRVFLIDRDGVLRTDSPAQLEAEIAELFRAEKQGRSGSKP